MISPQHLINTGICGLFCVTLFSLAASKPDTKPVVLTRPLPIAQDYTLHIKTSKVEERNFTPMLKHGVQQVRSLEERNEEAREKRLQFEMLFARPNSVDRAGNSSSVTTTIIVHPEEPSVILKRARRAVYHSIEVGLDAGEGR